jgi:hypothetical protein
MRAISVSPLAATHSDFDVIRRIEMDLLKRAGGIERIKADLPRLIRQAIDEVIDTPRTGRVHASELEKTEKTYIGTKVEILVRNYFGLPKGILDLQIDGLDVDVKNTLANNWMIPKEAVGKPCILVYSDEDERRCGFGVVVAHSIHLRSGKNQDKKTSISSAGFGVIHWLMADVPYEESFWSALGTQKTHEIMKHRSGTARLEALFRESQDRPVHRDIIEATAQQKDYMKRLRRNGGARDPLAAEGIGILSGNYDSKLIKALGLPPIGNDEFISHKAANSDELSLLKKHGKID